MPTRGINWVFATSVVMAIVGTSIPAGLAAAITVTSLLFAIWVRAKTSQIGLITALWLSFWLAHPISPKPIPFNLDQDKADAERAAGHGGCGGDRGRDRDAAGRRVLETDVQRPHRGVLRRGRHGRGRTSAAIRAAGREVASPAEARAMMGLAA